jgi:molybdenum cofactor biosynthesis enzyme MoaA
MRTYFQYCPTFRCNLNCSYCPREVKIAPDGKSYKVTFEDRKTFEIAEEIPWAYLLHLLNRWRPYHLEITGGEPMLYAGFNELLSHMPRDCSWAITTNTLITDVVQKISANTPPMGWSSSYHYHSDAVFAENTNYLRTKGIPVKVNMVLTPRNGERIIEKLKYFQDLKLPAAIIPMIREGFTWKDHIDIYNRFKNISRELNSPYIYFVPTPINNTGAPPTKGCCGGHNYFHLFPDGRMFRCLSDCWKDGVEPVGNLETFVRPEKEQPCEAGCTLACDVEVYNGRYRN